MKTNFTFTMSLFIILTIIFNTSLNAQILANGEYLLVNAVNNEAMTAPNTFADSSPNPDFFAYMTAVDTSDDTQIFTFTHLGNDVYTIMNNSTGNYLGIRDSWCGDFGNVQGKFQQTDTNIEFKIIAASITDTYTIEIAFTQCNFGSINDPIKAFDIDGGNVGARINTFTKDPMNANQQWQIVSLNVLDVVEFESKADRLFSVFPVPADQYLELQFAKELGKNISIQMYNSFGQLKLTKKLQNGQVTSRLDVNTITSGLYLISIVDESGTTIGTRKITIN